MIMASACNYAEGGGNRRLYGRNADQRRLLSAVFWRPRWKCTYQKDFLVRQAASAVNDMTNTCREREKKGKKNLCFIELIPVSHPCTLTAGVFRVSSRLIETRREVMGVGKRSCCPLSAKRKEMQNKGEEKI